MPAAKRTASKPPQKRAVKSTEVDLTALRGKFVKAASFTPEGRLVSVEFFSPTEIFDANLRRSTAATMAAAEKAPTGGPSSADFDETHQMLNYRKRAEEAAANGDNETAGAYWAMYNRDKWESLSTWSG